MYQCVDFEGTDERQGKHKNEIIGMRIRFLSTNIPPHPILKFNDLGTVAYVIMSSYSMGGQLHLWIRWDNGSNYPLIYGIDSFDIFAEVGI